MVCLGFEPQTTNLLFYWQLIPNLRTIARYFLQLLFTLKNIIQPVAR